jgi:hypothetical protein
MLKARPQIQNDFVVPAFTITHVWHLTHVSNLSSIFNSASGLLSKNALQQHSASYYDISMHEVQAWRANRLIDNVPLHNYVPTYVVQRNPMMYRLRNLADQLVWLKIGVNQLPLRHCITADRNAAALKTQFYKGIESECLAWDVLTSPTWNDYPEGKSLRCAEILVRDRIPLAAIVAAEVSNFALVNHIEAEYGLFTSYAPNKFFQHFSG